MTQFKETLERLGACKEARAWVGEGSFADKWEECARADWLLWLAAAAGVDRRLSVRAACVCARTALVYVPAGEDRPRVAIETAEAWCRGEATLEQVRAARAAAYAAHAAHAACAAYAAANAADAVAYATNAAAYAADAADAARKHALAEMSVLVRSNIPATVVYEALHAYE